MPDLIEMEFMYKLIEMKTYLHLSTLHLALNSPVKTLDTIVNGSGMEITPLVLSITDFEESDKVRTALDASLKKNKKQSVQTVADTIFPSGLYELFDNDRHELYREYMEILPRMKKIDSKRNGKGLYFERLIAYNGTINQLEGIITNHLNGTGKGRGKGVRRSKLQASIFDPKCDHITDRYQGFPCLQHVTCYIDEKGGLVLNSFYAIQYLYQKAYGNWLGLINLGKFLAREMQLDFHRLNCFVGVEHLEEIKKGEAETLLASMV